MTHTINTVSDEAAPLEAGSRKQERSPEKIKFLSGGHAVQSRARVPLLFKFAQELPASREERRREKKRAELASGSDE